MDAHYDPAYERSRKRGRCGPPMAQFVLDALDGATLDGVAKEIASAQLSDSNKKA